MPRPAFSFALLLTALIMTAACGAARAAAIQDPDMVVLPDPNPATAVHFPPGAATAGAARISPALDEAVSQDCSARNPCALATPALSDAAGPKPGQRVGARQRVRRSG